MVAMLLLPLQDILVKVNLAEMHNEVRTNHCTNHSIATSVCSTAEYTIVHIYNAKILHAMYVQYTHPLLFCHFYLVVLMPWVVNVWCAKVNVIYNVIL